MPNHLSILLRRLLGWVIVGSSSYLTLQALQGNGVLVVGSLALAAAGLVVWHRVKAFDLRNAPAKNDLSQEKGASAAKKNEDAYQVVQVTLAKPAHYRQRLDMLEGYLAKVKLLEQAGGVADPLARAALHEEIRYARVMLQIAEQVVQRGRTPTRR